MSRAESNRTYSGQPVAERRVARRARFLDSALSVFAEKTYAHSSISDICAHAGLSRRQFYEEFGSREDILLALYDTIQDEARDAVLAANDRAPSRDPRTVAGSVMTAYIESVGTDERRARIIFVEVVGAGPRVEQYRLARRTQWAELFEVVTRTIDGGVVDPPERFAMVSIAFIGAVNDLAHHWSTASPRPSASVLADVLSTMLIALVTDQT
ncbi:AcrR family transcriptional regulator [Rhodococcus percolatus]|uniref:TetR family transcriptional regulator n=1 Tax=Rhodococcus opacus TaxID=37919 RepID=A0A1B1JZG5_RHOOP|nr:TetR/AcrR family transcriptional regulator [Rhodococcus opacus]ANS25742.1 TetR family transcriptional regulator [Rhodococcus opacus]MBA8958608.1 AcrR family transcriptional regulator [Rhodococcus opacus]MBP2204173.1 AcrR family transcriptional regulator [Rhodococcus opacus]